ncbi:MAG: hypothetical protein AAF902_13925 [Chloroflexota bacterium]
MGHRANLIIVNEEGYELYYCHWCSLAIPNNMFWGPTHARAFIQNQQLEDELWVDNIWAEGGVVYDPIEKVLLFWGGEHLLNNIPLRRLYLELMQHQWPDWHLRWARGIFDLAEYVGKELPTFPDLSDVIFETLSPPEDLSEVDAVCTIRFLDEDLFVFSTSYGIALVKWLSDKEEFLSQARQRRSQKRFDFAEHLVSFPVAGMHVDEAQKRILFWCANAYFFNGLELDELWAGWDIQFVYDRFEDHINQVEEAVTIPSINEESLLETLVEILIPQDGYSPLDLIARMMSKFHEDDSDSNVQVNPHALQYNPLELSIEIREEILANAIHKWEESKG